MLVPAVTVRARARPLLSVAFREGCQHRFGMTQHRFRTHTHSPSCSQFGTMSYMVTSNLMYYHDGDTWVTRDWDDVFKRYQKKPSKPQLAPDQE